MARLSGLLLLLALAGCAGLGRSEISPHDEAAPCAAGENSYECQVIRYRNAP
jgi:hypothetical protein